MGILKNLAKEPPLSDLTDQRLRAFRLFVQNHKEAAPVWDVYLHGEGLVQWYGPASFETWNYSCCRVLLGDKSGTVVRFDTMENAREYAALLKGILVTAGYVHSKVWAEEIYVLGTIKTNWFLGTKAVYDLSPASSFLIRMHIK